ncbi:MAG: NAD-dependent deacetylase [Candidatus Cloacimonetes bacterium]|nr:NAD-dependent deacetylase [Candidatus Cloacimonadota bacterium]
MINIDSFDKILITAGAGMGVDSGLPDFRGEKGFWKAYPLLKNKNLSFVDMANPRAFKLFPKLAWGFYGHRLALYRQTEPHAGFKILLDLCKKSSDYFVVTSNVDGHFQKSGFVDSSIYEVHGSINYLQCTKCSINPYKNELDLLVDMSTFQCSQPPTCNCGALLRPNILMFGDFAWDDSIFFKQEQRYRRFLSEITDNDRLLIIELGAGLSVPTIQIQSNSINSRFKNSYLVRINPRDFEVSGDRSESIVCGALDGLNRLLQANEGL